jgi:hypothetical protein
MIMSSWFYRSMIGAVLLLGLVIVLGAPERAFAEVPSQLDDQMFWRLINDLSEKGGVFTSENLVSNEPNFQVILTKLKQRVKPGGALPWRWPRTELYLYRGSEAVHCLHHRHSAPESSGAFDVQSYLRNRRRSSHVSFAPVFPATARWLNENSTLEGILNAFRRFRRMLLSPSQTANGLKTCLWQSMDSR